MTVEQAINKCGVIPVLAFDNLDCVEPAVQALVAGGLPVLEITLRTPVALQAIEMAKHCAPEAVIGVGSVTHPGQIDDALKAGGEFIVSPGHTAELLKAARENNTVFLPGVATAAEMMTVRDAGFTFQKLFPASSIGGPSFIKSIGGPLPEIRFCPTGGVSAGNMQEYFQLPNVVCVGGSWLMPKDIVAAGDWREIQQLASSAANAAANHRS